MHTQGASQYVFVDTPGFQTIHGNALNKSLNKAVQGAVGDVDVVFLVVEAGSFTPADEKVLSLLAPGIPTLLVANKLDSMKNRPEIMQWLQSMQERHPFVEIVPMSAKNDKDVQRLLGIAEKYLPEQAWMYASDELTDRSEKFMAAEMVREKLFRLTGDELPYTSTVVIDKFEEEKRKDQRRQTHDPHCRHHRGGARWPQSHGDWRQRRTLEAHGHGSAHRARKNLRRQSVFRAVGQSALWLGR